MSSSVRGPPVDTPITTNPPTPSAGALGRGFGQISGGVPVALINPQDWCYGKFGADQGWARRQNLPSTVALASECPPRTGSELVVKI
jgi:hypothetical protein